MDIKVTVVVMSKNVEQYISKCLDSIVGQTLKEIEILIFDAFSTDRTREIIASYMNDDNRIVLIDDDKLSTGYCVNQAIKRAKGSYICFLEADDYIDGCSLQKLYQVTINNDVDYVKGNGYTRVAETGDFSFNEHVSNFDIATQCLLGNTINPQDYPELHLYDTQRWNGMYKTTFLKEKKIISNESKGAAYQDLGFLFQVIDRAQTAYYMDYSFYNYRIDNPNSSMNNKNGLVKLYDEWIYSKKTIKDACAQDFWKYYYYKFIKGGLVRKSAFLARHLNNKELYDCFENIRKMYIEGLESEKCQLRDYDYYTATQIRMLVESSELFINYWYIQYLILNESSEIIDDEMIVFGTGNTGIRFFGRKALTQQMYSIKAFCDNDINKQNNKLYGKEVLSVEKAVNLYPNALFIVASDLHYLEMKNQLKKEGICEDRIYVYRTTGIEL